MFKSEIYKEIEAYYERLQQEANKILKARLDLCYQKCDRIRQIDEEIQMVGIKISKTIIDASSLDKEKLIEKIKKETKNLMIEKENLLLENGFSKQYLRDIYICQNCKDSGYINTKKCKCYEQKLIEKAYDISNLKEAIKEENFEVFKYEYYSKELDKEKGISPYDRIRNIIKECMIFIEEFDINNRSLLFYGETGLGKTFVCKSIAKELLDRGKTVLYTTAFDLFSQIEKEKFKKNDENTINKINISDFIKNVDLLIIDDLGTEFSTSLSTAEFFRIINTRILHKKSTIISTNFDAEDIEKRYSNRTTSRIWGIYEIYEFLGQDIRINKKIMKDSIK